MIFALSPMAICSVGLAVHQKRPVKAFEITGSALDPSAQVTKNVLTVKTLLSPLAREEVKLVRCLGLNYTDHAVSSLSSTPRKMLKNYYQAEANLPIPLCVVYLFSYA